MAKCRWSVLYPPVTSINTIPSLPLGQIRAPSLGASSGSNPSNWNRVFKGHSRPLFVSLFSSFQQWTEKTLITKFRQWLDSNRGPLGLESTALPTKPQPLPIGTEFSVKKEWARIVVGKDKTKSPYKYSASYRRIITKLKIILIFLGTFVEYHAGLSWTLRQHLATF